MKKILVIGLISSFFSAGAFAAACTATATTSAQAGAAGNATTPVAGEQCVCDGGTAFKNRVNGGAGTVITTPLFIRTGFDVQCSANTIVSYNEVNANAFAVSSGSKKGNRTFQGSSAGGGIAESAVCGTTGCTAADVTTANGLATTASSS